MILYPGDIGVDYSEARPDPRLMFDLGVRFAVRYISPIRAHRKNATVSELGILHDNGIATPLVWEDKRTDAFGDGATGRAFGPMAESFARDLGYPLDDTLWVACDSDTVPATIPTALAYLAAFDANCAYTIKPYGEADLIDAAVDAGICDGGWESYAWSHGRISPNADVFQEYGFTRYPHLAVLGNVDCDTVLRSFSAWSHDTPQPPEVDDMGAVRRFVRDDRPDGEWEVWLQDVDDALIGWAAAINAHPIPWGAYAYPSLPIVPFAVLDALPHTPTPNGPTSGVSAHRHDGGVTGPTGDVIR